MASAVRSAARSAYAATAAVPERQASLSAPEALVAKSDNATTLIGEASASVCGHHGELLQGAFESGRSVRRGLVTLPCPLVRARVRVALRRDEELAVYPDWKKKARRAAEVTLASLGQSDVGGSIRIVDEVATCRGFGSSTVDVTATIVATLTSLGLAADPHDVARLCVEAEVASDPLIFDTAVLFAQREGVIIEDFRRRLPKLRVIGFSFSDAHPIDTIDFPPAPYSEREHDIFAGLRALMRRALATSDSALLGLVATTSARINHRYLPRPLVAEIAAQLDALGAVGLQVAHTGSVGGLLYDARMPGVAAVVERGREALERLDLGETWEFDVGN